MQELHELIKALVDGETVTMEKIREFNISTVILLLNAEKRKLKEKIDNISVVVKQLKENSR